MHETPCWNDGSIDLLGPAEESHQATTKCQRPRIGRTNVRSASAAFLNEAPGRLGANSLGNRAHAIRRRTFPMRGLRSGSAAKKIGNIHLTRAAMRRITWLVGDSRWIPPCSEEALSW